MWARRFKKRRKLSATSLAGALRDAGGQQTAAWAGRAAVARQLLHEVENPDVTYRDSPAQDHSGKEGKYTLVFADPPFAGRLTTTPSQAQHAHLNPQSHSNVVISPTAGPRVTSSSRRWFLRKNF